MGFRRGFKAEANRISLRVRAKLALTNSDPIDPADVCRHFDIDLIELSTLSVDAMRFLQADQSSFSAVIVPRGHRTAIVHNDAHHPFRQRSNISSRSTTSSSSQSNTNWTTCTVFSFILPYYRSSTGDCCLNTVEYHGLFF